MALSKSKLRLRWSLWAIALAGTVLWLYIVAVGNFPWWYAHYAAAGWAVPFKAVPVNPQLGYDAPLVWSSDNVWEVALMGTTVLVAWCAAGFMMLWEEQLESRDTTPEAPTRWLLRGIHARRFMSYQLPPRKFWVWLTGGLCGLDLLVASVIVGLNLIWLISTWVREYARINSLIQSNAFAVTYVGLTKNQVHLQYAGYSFAWAIAPNILMITYPVPRSCFLHWICGTEMPRIIKYHRWLGHLLLWNVSLHGLCRYTDWWLRGVWVQHAWQWSNTSGVNLLAGTLAWICVVPVWITSTNWMRRRYYKVFRATHCLGISLFMLFSFAHVPQMAVYAISGWFLYLLDLALRLVQRRCNTSTAVCVINEQAQVLNIRLTFRKEVKVLPTQYVYVKFPTISTYQRHPFSIASIDRDPDTRLTTVGLYVKALGDWTKRLQAGAGSGGEVEVVVEGPYGYSGGYKWRKAEVLFLVAGGVGVTSILSILQDILATRAAGLPSPPHVYFTWMSRNVVEFQLMAPEVLLAAESAGGEWLTIQLCDTSKEGKPVLVGSATPHGRDIPAQRPLRALGYGYWFYSIAVLLSALGGWAALLPGQAYQAAGAREYGYNNGALGSKGWGVGFIHWPCILIGCMLPPFLMAAGVHAYGWLCGTSAAAAAPRSEGESSEPPPLHPCITVLLAPPSPTRALAGLSPKAAAVSMRDNDAARGDGKGTGSSGSMEDDAPPLTHSLVDLVPKALGQMTASDRFVKRGRPDIGRILADIRLKHSNALEVLLYVSGPKPMCRSVRDECQACVGAPYPDCHMLSFSM